MSDGIVMLADHMSFQPAGAGFLLGLGFIFSIGPQNLQLIRSGAFHDNPATVATTGYLSEILIVSAGLAGLASSLDTVPAVATGLRALGIAFLLWYGVRSILRRNDPMAAAANGVCRRTRAAAALAMLAATWLNPLVYVEIVFLVGVISSGFADLARLSFGIGFLAASAIRFYGWSLAGRLIHPWLAVRRRRARFGIVSGCCLLCSAALLANDILRDL